MLATGGVMANEVFVTCIQPLREGEEAYAMSFAVPMNAKGLKILSRKSYEEGATSVFDNPLASRFDENDAAHYFDDVKVPGTASLSAATSSCVRSNSTQHRPTSSRIISPKSA